ncbi:winged helix-turn-helix domain-containing protein [Brevundimonas faecalis]|uniref:winged helix-turn-helix domain-containing protein n=1 Tax=Brevundimonas faecalis TaxID=947378 RepID=UPI003612AF59
MTASVSADEPPRLHEDVRFNGYLLRARPLALWRGDVLVDVPRQSLELLAYLIACGDRPATREALIRRFWSMDHAGADQNLNACVKRLRKALVESGGEDLIETQARIGYRFVGTIDAQDRAARKPRARLVLIGASAAAVAVVAVGAVYVGALPAPSPGSSPASLASPKAVRIAVPPGRNLCDTTLFPMFIDGLRENLIADLQTPANAEVAFLKIDAKEPQSQDPEAAYVLDLGVRQMPDRTIANLSLVSARDGEVIWTRQVSEPTNLANYLDTQQRLSSRLAEAFSAQTP